MRRRAVPTELQGRLGSVNLVGTFGGLVIGAASAVFLVLIWPQLTHLAHQDEQVPNSGKGDR